MPDRSGWSWPTPTSSPNTDHRHVTDQRSPRRIDLKPITIHRPDGSPGLAGLSSNSSGPRVLALHGWLDNAHSFLPLAAHLGELELVCPDFPGHGLSPARPAGSRYAFDDYVFDALAAADSLEWDRFHLIGHSLGGAASTVLAAAAPERIRSLSLIEGLGPLSAPPTATAAGWRRAVAEGRTRDRRVHASREAAILSRCRNSDLSSEAATLLAERGLEAVDDGWCWRHDLRATWPSTHRYTEPQVLDLIGAIECPVLNLVSSPPTRISAGPAMQRRIAALRRPAGLVTMPGGHHLHMVRPAEAARPILETIHAAD